MRHECLTKLLLKMTVPLTNFQVALLCFFFFCIPQGETVVKNPIRCPFARCRGWHDLRSGKIIGFLSQASIFSSHPDALKKLLF